MTHSYVFLLGSERSGSNLLTRMFDAHPAVCGPAPTHIGSDLLGNLQRYPRLSGSDRADFLDDFLALFDTKMGVWQTRPQRSDLARALKDSGPLEAYLQVYRNEADSANKAAVFIKENHLYRWATLLSPILHRTRFVYLCRDPRDMALSWKNAPALRGGVLRAANQWATDQSAFLALRAQLRSVTGLPVPSIHYEALLDAPEETLRAVCSALGMPYEKAMLAFHSKGENHAQARTVQEWKNIGSPLMAGNHGKYRKGLTEEEIAVVEAICCEEMESLGYPATQPLLDEANLNAARDRLSLSEPWNKPAYQALSEAERGRREQQHEVFTRIRTRAFTIPEF